MFVQIIDDVKAWFESRGITAVVDDGPEARNSQTNYDPDDGRVVFVVAADPMAVVAPTFIGGEPRQLLNAHFVFEVVFTGYDSTNPSRDLCHRRECIGLWEATAQAVQRAYYGAHEWGSGRWEDARKYGRFGAELVVTLTLNVPLFDVASDSATPQPVPGAPKPA